MSVNGSILNGLMALLLIFVGGSAVQASGSQSSGQKLLFMVAGGVAILWGLGIIFAPEGMMNISGPSLKDAYPATTTPIAQPGWTQSSESQLDMANELSSAPTGLDSSDNYSSYSPANMDYTFGQQSTVNADGTGSNVPATVTM